MARLLSAAAPPRETIDIARSQMTISITRGTTIAPTRKRRGRGVPAFAYFAVAPTLVLMTLIVALPLLYSLYLSFNSTNPITKRWIFVGLANYERVFQDAAFWASLGRTLYFSVLALSLIHI